MKWFEDGGSWFIVFLCFQCVFTDPQNQVIFVTKDYGKNIMRIKVSFTPSEVSFHEDEPLIFLVYDKANSAKQVNLRYYA